jgi:hypothetical protein
MRLLFVIVILTPLHQYYEPVDFAPAKQKMRYFSLRGAIFEVECLIWNGSRPDGKQNQIKHDHNNSGLITTLLGPTATQFLLL